MTGKTLVALLLLMLLLGMYVISDDGPLQMVNSIAWVGALFGIVFVFMVSHAESD